jgi:hypothetical protein
MTEKQIVSKERVKTLAEVLTASREVKDMIALVDEFTQEHNLKKERLSWSLTSKFLEPSCGTGNFLVEIISNKLERATQILTQEQPKKSTPFYPGFLVFQATSSIYGIDIDDNNIKETINRLYQIIEKWAIAHIEEERSKLLKTIKVVLDNNIVLGDSLSGKHLITFIDYSYPKDNYVSYAFWSLSEIEEKAKGLPIWKPRSRMRHYLEFGNEMENLK